MYKKIFLSFSFLFSLTSLLICNTLWNIESSGILYAAEGESIVQDIFFFFPLSPWSYFGLPSLMSLFYHQGANHLIFNIIFMMIVAFPFERKWGSLKTLYIFILLHIISLYVASFFFFTNSALSGLSLGTCALYSLRLTLNKSYLKLLLLYMIIYFSFKKPLYTSIDVHLIAIVCGSLFSLFLKRILFVMPTKSSHEILTLT